MAQRRGFMGRPQDRFAGGRDRDPYRTYGDDDRDDERFGRRYGRSRFRDDEEDYDARWNRDEDDDRDYAIRRAYRESRRAFSDRFHERDYGSFDYGDPMSYGGIQGGQGSQGGYVGAPHGGGSQANASWAQPAPRVPFYAQPHGPSWQGQHQPSPPYMQQPYTQQFGHGVGYTSEFGRAVTGTQTWQAPTAAPYGSGQSQHSSQTNPQHWQSQGGPGLAQMVQGASHYGGQSGFSQQGGSHGQPQFAQNTTYDPRYGQSGSSSGYAPSDPRGFAQSGSGPRRTQDPEYDRWRHEHLSDYARKLDDDYARYMQTPSSQDHRGDFARGFEDWRRQNQGASETTSSKTDKTGVAKH